MMTPRENIISLLKRKGYDYMPVYFEMCPSLEEDFCKRMNFTKENWKRELQFPFVSISASLVKTDKSEYAKYYEGCNLRPDTRIDSHGVAHEYSPHSMHLNHMVHPLRNAESVEDILDYPFRKFLKDDGTIKAKIDKAHSDGYAALCSASVHIWEYAWAIRSMEGLMIDMMTDEEMANALLDRITDDGIAANRELVELGCDAVLLGDDIGMQKSPMMSIELYRKFLKPHLAKMISSLKEVNPDVIIIYHSCGYVLPFIDDLIEAGVDVLNPIQPESQTFQEVFDKYHDKLSFYGGIGTQTTMPFGTTDDVRHRVKELLDYAGEYGGLLATPTHMLEPDVPIDNILAYIDACRNYK